GAAKLCHADEPAAGQRTDRFGRKRGSAYTLSRPRTARDGAACCRGDAVCSRRRPGGRPVSEFLLTASGIVLAITALRLLRILQGRGNSDRIMPPSFWAPEESPYCCCRAEPPTRRRASMSHCCWHCWRLLCRLHLPRASGQLRTSPNRPSRHEPDARRPYR